MAEETPPPPPGDEGPPSPPGGEPAPTAETAAPVQAVPPPPSGILPAGGTPYGVGRVEASTDKTLCILCHALGILGGVVNGFTGGFFGWVGLLGPLIIWLVKKDDSPAIAAHGNETVNFQIWILILTLILVVATFATCGIGALLTIPALWVLGVYSIVMNVVGALKAADGNLFRYPLTMRVL